MEVPRRADLRLPVPAGIVGAGSAAALVAAAFVVPQLASDRWRLSLYAAAAPIFGSWLPHIGWGSGPAIGIAALVAAYGPGVAARLRWGWLPLLSWVVALAWAFALAMVDGWDRGFAGRLEEGGEYLPEVRGITDIPATLRGFSARILDFQPDSWTTHTSGHPPGAVLFFVLLDRIGLSGGGWAGVACLLIGCSAVAAILITVRALGAEDRARAAAPFLVLAPAALWIAVSADAVFAGVTAWAMAALALAATRLRPGLALLAGVLFGLGIFLNYGLVLMAIPAVAVLVAARNWRPLVPALIGAGVVVVAFAAAGFWWLTGYHLVVQRYYQGVASTRPITYWIWGNLAATVCATGLAVPAALPRAVSRVRAWDPTALVVTAALAAILAADLSGMSKAETERIWLPFDLWLLAATAFLPRRDARLWLTVQAAGTLALTHLLLTNW
ncbi:hypothetical protein [Nocardia stercoris]|uniref:DUF2029 domain-containing protein n=1 Tax=Nocardia stercoris TaxID=2483361 RepID=A0A3M2LE82_9NOCA|nr:hypothetical protein [Nocardia stercoris]RMI35714.1 hypothetical protein EBN03_00975 [Nocardia stercoris]